MYENLADHAFSRGVAGGERQLAGRLLFQGHVQDHAVRGRAGLFVDLHIFEEAKTEQPQASLIHHYFIIGIAFSDPELTPDDVILGAVVAGEIDALDVDARALLHDEHHRDRPSHGIAVDPRPHLTESVSLLGHGHRQGLRRLVDQLRVIDVPRLSEHTAARHLGVEARKGRFDIHAAEMVELTLIDRECQKKSFALAVNVSHGRHHSHIRVAIFDVVPAEKLAIEVEAVGIVNRSRFQKVEKAQTRSW